MESGDAYERAEEKTKPGQSATKERKQQKHPGKETSFLLSWFSPLPRGSNPAWNLQALHDTLIQSSLQRTAWALPKNIITLLFMRTTGLYEPSAQTGLCIGKSNQNTDNLRAAVKDLNGELQQTSGKHK